MKSFACGGRPGYKITWVNVACQQLAADELWAVVYGTYKLGVPIKATAKEEKVQKAQQYQRLLVVNGQSLPDPFCDLVSGWVGEENGMQNWPP